MNRKERRAAATVGSAVSQWLGTGLRHHQAGRLAEAEAYYRQVLAAQPDHVAAYFYLGNLLVSQGKLDEAVAAFRQAIRIKPDLVEPHSNLGDALASQGKLVKWPIVVFAICMIVVLAAFPLSNRSEFTGTGMTPNVLSLLVSLLASLLAATTGAISSFLFKVTKQGTSRGKGLP
jgi:tetratricopeptide (TPR) repeat protein